MEGERGAMHAKTDSEVTSLATSSPGRSPGRRAPIYYVQSPSHDDNKTTTSFQSSPSASPPRHYASSSSTGYSASLKPTATNSRNAAVPGHHHHHHQHVYPIEEENLLDDEDDNDEDDRSNRLPRRFYYLSFFLAFFLLFAFFSLVLWGASRNQKPVLHMKSLRFSVLHVHAGTDATGVQTDMADVNSTVVFSFKNRGTFFGVHVTSTPLDLLYSRLKLASGDMDYFYQRRKSERKVKVKVSGSRVPLYGSGAYLSIPSGRKEPTDDELRQFQEPVPLTLLFKLRARANVLGKLVRTKFYINVNCSVLLVLTNLTEPIPLHKECSFH